MSFLLLFNPFGIVQKENVQRLIKTIEKNKEPVQMIFGRSHKNNRKDKQLPKFDPEGVTQQ